MTAIPTATNVVELEDLASYVGCRRMSDEEDRDYGRRILIRVKRRAEFLAHLHSTILDTIGQDHVEPEFVEHDIHFGLDDPPE